MKTLLLAWLFVTMAVQGRNSLLAGPVASKVQDEKSEASEADTETVPEKSTESNASQKQKKSKKAKAPPAEEDKEKSKGKDAPKKEGFIGPM
ncbi:MAG: hypothetical protein EOP04_20885, partial [Proteobacteria bacterium]